MFDNVGRTIKNVAVVFCFIGIGLSVILGFILSKAGSAGLGIAVLIGGPLISWLGSLLTYGFGELVENVAIIAGVEEKEEEEEEGVSLSKNQVKCKKCGAPISEMPCPYCGWES